jgi:two-component system chemotaxis response regulator CheB
VTGQQGNGDPFASPYVVAVGASAGGVEALSKLVAGLPAEFPAAVLVVLHVAPGGTSVLPSILARQGALAARTARDGDPLQTGCVVVAPPDRHLLVTDGHLAVQAGPRENGHRPAVDALFRSVAAALGPRAIGVILSGTLDDGTLGLGSVKRRGGTAIVQAPDDAAYPGMPSNAIEHVDVDHVLAVGEIPELLARLVHTPPGAMTPASDPVPEDSDPMPAWTRGDAVATGLSCPECGGSLWERREGASTRFVCRTGHAYSAQSMLTEQGKSMEAALWAALNALEERADLLRRLARRTGRDRTTRRFTDQARETDEQAASLRTALAELPLVEGDELPEAGEA